MRYGKPPKTFEEQADLLLTVRNRCAHHLRLYNWELGTPVLIPQERKFPAWHAPRLPNHRIGIILTLCRHWLDRISPENLWSQRVLALFDEFPGQPVAPMGFGPDWRRHPLWVVAPAPQPPSR